LDIGEGMTIRTSNSTDHAAAKNALSRPEYISAREDGFYITLSKFHSGSDFEIFVDELFLNNFCFADINYNFFLKLLFDVEWLAMMRDKVDDLKIASGISQFPPNRRELYKTVKVLDGGKKAEYVFEPVQLEVSMQIPVYGQVDEQGHSPIVSYTTSKTLQPATLSLDEFVAVMWVKGIKYGIQAEEVSIKIAERFVGRGIVAVYLPPTPGSDAELLEVCPDLHRDNSPKTLLNGKTDLRAFQNRFPHISNGTRLIKKIPRVMGKPGYSVTGLIIEPAIPMDINLLALASTGTTAKMEADGAYLVAVMDGFLTIDTETNIISIAEKIVTKAGISMKTTGDLMLNVEEFIEHGEVQEGRVVKGRHMTFKADVFGSLISSSGDITVDGNLTGGMADAVNGNITLGRASRSSVRSLKGLVTAKSCENCTIIAKKIIIERAVNCELIADEIAAENVEGCSLTGKSINVLSSCDSKSRETLVTMVIPDLSELDANVVKLKNKIIGIQEEVENRRYEIEQLKSDADFAKFMALYGKIKSGEIRLSTEQAENWQKLVSKNSRAWNQLENINKQVLGLEHLKQEAEAEVTAMLENRDAVAVGLTCVIDTVKGLTRGQTMTSVNGLRLFDALSGTDILILLRRFDHHKQKIFSADDGLINWQYQ
jgi:uncharacterized protein